MHFCGFLRETRSGFALLTIGITLLASMAFLGSVSTPVKGATPLRSNPFGNNAADQASASLSPNPNLGTSPAAADPPLITPFQPNIKWGGRAVAVDVSHANTAVAIVASESGGLFKTTDSGTTWSHLDSLPPFRISDVKIAPSNDQIVIATGWNFAGIWRSVDGGATWQQPTNSTPTCPFTTQHPDGWGISFAPDTNDVYVGTTCTVAVSHDLGATWTHVALGQTDSVIVSPGGIVDTCSDDGHHRSTNNGVTFSLADGPSVGFGCRITLVHAIAVSPLESNVLFITNKCGSLFESDDQGKNWKSLNPVCGARPSFGTRPPWVKTHMSPDGNPMHFDLYYGTGSSVLLRQTCTGTFGPGLRCSTSSCSIICSATEWSSVGIGTEGQEPNDMVFSTSSSNCPQFVLSDAGVSRTLDCGGSWAVTGGGNGGFNALQLYEVDGQVHPTKTALYIGTQDNDIWSSADTGVTWTGNQCCEGFDLQISHSSPSDDGQIVTGVACAPCNDFKLTAQLGCPAFAGICFGGAGYDGSAWADAPNHISPPFLIQQDSSIGEYIQWSNRTTVQQPHTFELDLTLDYGSIWQGLTTISQFPVGRPYVSGPPSSPTIYQTVDRGFGLGLIKITGVGSSTVTVSPADTGLNSIPQYSPSFSAWVKPAVWGVSPSNPQHLIAADASTQQIKVSIDGGNTWNPDPMLTNLVINGNGQFLFNEGLGHVIAFDPNNEARILVGTEDAGIIACTSGCASLDGSQTWAVVPGSEKIPAITSFFFDEVQHTVYVSSYGRGLWKLNIPMPSHLDVSCVPAAILAGGATSHNLGSVLNTGFETTSTMTVTDVDLSSSLTPSGHIILIVPTSFGLDLATPCSLALPFASDPCIFSGSNPCELRGTSGSSASCSEVFSSWQDQFGVVSIDASYTGDALHEVSDGSFLLTVDSPVNISGVSSTSVSVGGSGNTVITGYDPSGSTLFQINYPPGTDFSTGTINGDFTRSPDGTTQLVIVSGPTLPVGGTKTVSISTDQSKPPPNTICVVDSPTPPLQPNCNTTDPTSDVVVFALPSTNALPPVSYPCDGSHVTSLSGFPVGEPQNRDYTCSQTGALVQITGLSYSLVQTMTVRIATSTSINCSPSPATAGVLESCTATVANGDPIYDIAPSGPVTFGGNLPSGMPATCALTPGLGASNKCSVSWTPSSGTEGSYSISASYGGDSTHFASPISSGFDLNIQTTTSTTITTCSSPAIVGVSETCTVVVTNGDSGYPAAPSGTITFNSAPGGFPSSCILSGGSCTLNWTPSFGSQGSYTLKASYGGDMTHQGSSGARGLVVMVSTAITYLGATSGEYSDPVSLKIVLKDGSGNPIPTETVTFSIGTQLSSGMTDSYGLAQTTLVLNQQQGSYTVTASFAGDSALYYLGSSVSTSFTLRPEPATLAYTGTTSVLTTTINGYVTLSAQVTSELDDPSGIIQNAMVTFVVYQASSLSTPVYSSNSVTVTQTSPGLGTSSLTIPCSSFGDVGCSNENTYIVYARLDPSANNYYTALDSYNTLVIFTPNGQFVTFGGWTIEPNTGYHANLGGVVRITSNGAIKGSFVYIYRGACPAGVPSTSGLCDYMIKSTSWSGGSLGFSSYNCAPSVICYSSFQAKGVLQVMDSITGAVLLSQGNIQIMVGAWDNTRTSMNGGVDQFTLSTVYPQPVGGVTSHRVGTVTSPVSLLGGNIVVHSR